MSSKNNHRAQNVDDLVTLKSGELPPVLDFFKYAQITGKRKAVEKQDRDRGKKRKVETGELDNAQEKTEGIERGVESTTQSEKVAHRVNTKGTKIPMCINSFDELKKYSIPSHLHSNLASSGYRNPTGIQSYCIPILLEVSCPP